MVAAAAFSRVRFGPALHPVWASGADRTFLGGSPSGWRVQLGLHRGREVYRASVEELLADGEVTAKERRMLGRLQEELGLDGSVSGRIEADVVEGGGDVA